MPEFGLSFTQAGAMMTVFFVVSGVGQALSGFVVDRAGPRRVLLAGIACFVLAGLLLSLANGYAMLLAVGALAGLGNCVFHPADFTVLNRKVSHARLGHAFSVHGLSGNIGWAIAPVFLTGIAAAAGWRAAALGAAALGALAWLVVWLGRDATQMEAADAKVSPGGTATTFGFLGAGAVWMCFLFFLLVTTAFGALQNYATPLMQNVYGLPVAAAAATLSFFLLGGAAGIAVGGVLVSRGAAHDRLIAASLSAAALVAVLIASGVLPAWSVSMAMGVMGFFGGIAGPSRDLLVRQAATARFGQQAFGRVWLRLFGAGYRAGGVAAGVRPAHGCRTLRHRAGRRGFVAGAGDPDSAGRGQGEPGGSVCLSGQAGFAVGQDDAVAAFVLGAIERGVRGADELRRHAFRGDDHRGDADADRDMVGDSSSHYAAVAMPRPRRGCVRRRCRPPAGPWRAGGWRIPRRRSGRPHRWSA
ncbi:MAG: MFS transporter [Rhodocyclaceae bacterium]|nr:MFS transporter [Rhodocyclaceae bacterium]